MNHPILKAAANVDYYAHTQRGEASIKVEQNSHRREYATVIRECSKERKSFIKGTEARWSNTTITTPTPYVSRRPRENLHEAAQGMPPLENCFVGEGLNEPPNSQGCSQCGLLRMHTRGRDSNKVEQNYHGCENATIIRECSKESQRFTKETKAHDSNTTIMTPTPDFSKRRGENLHQAAPGLPLLENGLVGEGLNEPPNSQGCNQCGIIMHTHKGERQY
jgi:hypothetical protein